MDDPTFTPAHDPHGGVTINEDWRSYAIPCGEGYTCLGFDVAFKRALAVATWIGGDCRYPDARNVGTFVGYYEYAYIMQQGALHARRTGTRCEADLTPQLVGLEGKRVEVVDADGHTRRFIVGKSSGWMPIHLEIARRTSHGGGGVYGAPFKSVRIVST